MCFVKKKSRITRSTILIMDGELRDSKQLQRLHLERHQACRASELCTVALSASGLKEKVELELPELSMLPL